MGLDMYLEGHTFNWTDWQHPEKNETRDGYRVKGVMLELGYWRKHPDLHGYIVSEFANGVDECQEIPLSESVAIFEKALDWLEEETAPVKREPKPLSDSGFTALEVKPEDFARAKESRDVIYRASW